MKEAIGDSQRASRKPGDDFVEQRPADFGQLGVKQRVTAVERVVRLQATSPAGLACNGEKSEAMMRNAEIVCCSSQHYKIQEYEVPNNIANVKANSVVERKFNQTTYV